MKAFIQSGDFDYGGECPECGKHNTVNEGYSVADDEGTFFYCAYCHKVSVLLYNGACFNYKGTIHQIVEMTLPEQDLIATIPTHLVSPNPFWKPNKTHYQYFPRQEIIDMMTEGYREDL
jgi:hypothetical protein